jgi:hypothetical protein
METVLVGELIGAMGEPLQINYRLEELTRPSSRD